MPITTHKHNDMSAGAQSLFKFGADIRYYDHDRHDMIIIRVDSVFQNSYVGSAMAQTITLYTMKCTGFLLETVLCYSQCSIMKKESHAICCFAP